MTDTAPIPWHFDQRFVAWLCHHKGTRQLQTRRVALASLTTVGLIIVAAAIWNAAPTPESTSANPVPGSLRPLIFALAMLAVASVWIRAALPVALYRQRVLLHHCGGCGEDMRLRPQTPACPACGEHFVPPPTALDERFGVRPETLDKVRARPVLSSPKRRGTPMIVPRANSLIAIWAASTMTVALAASFALRSSDYFSWSLPNEAFYPLFWIYAAVVILLMLRNIAFPKRLTRGHCGFCNYDLNPLPSATCCPECGQPIEPGTNRKPRTEPSRPTLPTQAP